MSKIGFRLYLLFTISWFLHLSARIPALGAIRLDMVLVVLIAFCAFLSMDRTKTDRSDKSGTILKVLLVYAIATIPFVEWPGSVINSGFMGLAKAIVFYYFTISLITTEARLKVFLAIFLGCQLFRVFEPAYLHVTTGYWGSIASMANWQFMDRLSGAPSDVINPNGLAFVILSVIPFLYYFCFVSWRWATLLALALPVCLYALVLTGSRSGLVGLLMIAVSIILKSRHKAALFCVMAVLMVAGFATLGSVQKDRYLSIVDNNTANAATSDGRVEGVKRNFEVAARRPIFGHGLGTSLEANSHFTGNAQPAHNLYAEIAQELGFVGLIIFVYFFVSVSKNFWRTRQVLKENGITGGFLFLSVNAMQTWLAMNILFSFASYGLSSYEWYLFGGLSVSAARIAVETVQQDEEEMWETACDDYGTSRD